MVRFLTIQSSPQNIHPQNRPYIKNRMIISIKSNDVIVSVVFIPPFLQNRKILPFEYLRAQHATTFLLASRLMKAVIFQHVPTARFIIEIQRMPIIFVRRLFYNARFYYLSSAFFTSNC